MRVSQQEWEVNGHLLLIFLKIHAALYSPSTKIPNTSQLIFIYYYFKI